MCVCVCVCVCVLIGLGASPLGHICRAYLGSTLDSAGTSSSCSTPFKAGVSGSHLFPSPPPFPDAPAPPRRRVTPRGKFNQLCARRCVNLIFGYFSFWELDSPKGRWVIDRQGLTQFQEIAAENLESELLSHLRPDNGFAPGAPVGGRARLAARLDILSSAQPGDVLQTDGSSPTALPVDPSRVALPEVAGTIDPLKVLPPGRCEIFGDLESHVRMPPSRWPKPLPKGCHTLPLEVELDFIRSLIARRIGRLRPKRSVVVDPHTGQANVAGFFCVRHKPSKNG